MKWRDVFFYPIENGYGGIDTFHTFLFVILLSTLYFCNLMRKASFTLVLCSLLGPACEKEMTGQQPIPTLPVVEGIIEENGYPMVRITRNMQYFAGTLSLTLSDSWVHGAVVTVSNGPDTQQLREYRLTDGAGQPYWAYTADTAFLPLAFRGETGKSYTLTIESEGKRYQSITTIPANGLRPDSVWWSPAKGGLMATLSGTPGSGNYARYFTARNREAFLPGLHPLSSELHRNGTFEVMLTEGVDRSRTGLQEALRTGDTVQLKLCNVDHQTYDFWRSTGSAWAEGKDPLGPQVRAKGNVSGAHGYWGGYSLTIEQIILK